MRNLAKIWPNGKWSYAWQQLSAVYLVVFLPGFVWTIWPVLIGLDYQSAQPGLLWLTSLIALALLFIHSWIGLRDVVIDYCPARHLPIAITALSLVFMLMILNITLLLTRWLLF